MSLRNWSNSKEGSKITEDTRSSSTTSAKPTHGTNKVPSSVLALLKHIIVQWIECSHRMSWRFTDDFYRIFSGSYVYRWLVWRKFTDYLGWAYGVSIGDIVQGRVTKQVKPANTTRTQLRAKLFLYPIESVRTSNMRDLLRSRSLTDWSSLRCEYQAYWLLRLRR